MFWFILTALSVLVVVGCLIFAIRARKIYNRETKEIAQGLRKRREILPFHYLGALLVLGFVAIMWLLITIGLSFYSQNPGQASVIVSFTGEVKGINYEPGLHTKAPWSSRVEYDIRNNTLSYVGTDGNTDNYVGGDVSGPQITFQDANGVTGNLDVNIRYSVRGDSVGNIYNEYKTQQEFVNAALAPAVRSKTREILSSYDTSQVYNNRDVVRTALIKSLQESWENLGVDVEEIYLQEVRYPQAVVDAFANVQSAKAMVEMAKANQEQARIEAETNLIKTQALTKEVLKEKLIEAIKNGSGTYVLGDLDLALGV